MDAKRFILALVVAAAGGLLAMRIASWIFPPPAPPTPPPSTQPEQTTPPPAMSQPQSQPSLPRVTSQPVSTDRIHVRPVATEPAEDLVLGSLDRPEGDEPYYLMQVMLRQRGAGVRRALLTDFFETPAKEGHYAVVDDRDLPPDQPNDLATTDVRLLDQTVALGEKDWRVAEPPAVEGGQGLTFVAELVQNGRPLLAIHKTFSLCKGSYELGVSYRLVNLSGGPLEVSLSDAGVLVPPREGVRGDERHLVWGHRSPGAETADTGKEGRRKIIKSPDEVKLPGTSGETGLVWAAAVNRFFAKVVRPVEPEAVPLKFQVTPLGQDMEHSRFRVAWSGEKIALPAEPDKPVSLPFSNFIGPKSRKLFTSDKEYIRLNYEKLISYGGCTWCMFEPLIAVMLWLLHGLYALVDNYGVAIMMLVAVVRGVLHPLTKKSQVSMSKMSKLQPKVEELKKQYGDNKQELNKAMAEFYRKEGFSPVLGCLPMLLQMPIWVALWGGLNASIELRHAPFFGWINDLAAPDALYQWAAPTNGYQLPLVGGLTGPIYALNLLPILLAVAMFAQQLLTPKTSAGPQAKQQRFMMYFMTGFFGLLFYGMPSGLTLYVMASTAVGVGEQYLIRKHIKQREEADAPDEAPRKKEKPPGGPRSRSRRRR